MLIRKEDQAVSKMPHVQGGEGVIERRIFLPQEEAAGAGRLFGVFTLQPGESIGLHRHTGEFEIYYVLQGEGEVTEDGQTYRIGPGDMSQCKDGSEHMVVAVGGEPFVFVAIILYTGR